MISKEDFKTLVETVCFSKSMTQGELSKDMKYGENYISEMLSPTGKLTEKFVNLFKMKYSEYLENPKILMPGITEIMRSQNALIEKMNALSQAQTIILTEIKTKIQDKVADIDINLEKAQVGIETIQLEVFSVRQVALKSLARIENPKGQEDVLLKEADSIVKKMRGNAGKKGKRD